MSARRAAATVPVYLEQGTKHTFVLALEWPGWARSGRDAETALDALAEYRDRYALVAEAAGLDLPPAPAFEIVERTPGTSTTDFGAPGAVPDLDRAPTWPATARDRQLALLEASWARLDAIVATAPEQLRKGPRGGGRDRDAIVAHVLDAEHAYRRKAGLRRRPPKDRAGHDEARADFVDLLRHGPGDDAPEPAWPARYALRRTAWHALDHAWEIEDKADPPA